MVAVLLLWPKIGRITGRQYWKVKGLTKANVDQPPAEQAVLERMIAYQFSIRPKDCWPGRFEDVAIEEVMPDYLYVRWLSLLQLFDRGALSVVMGHEDTDYYRHQLNFKGKVYAKEKVARFWRTYRSIKTRGFEEDRNEQPLILLRGCSVKVRIDGAHRASILRHLGLKSLPVYVVRKSDLQDWPVESEEQRIAIHWFLGCDGSDGSEAP